MDAAEIKKEWQEKVAMGLTERSYRDYLSGALEEGRNKLAVGEDTYTVDIVEDITRRATVTTVAKSAEEAAGIAYRKFVEGGECDENSESESVNDRTFEVSRNGEPVGEYGDSEAEDISDEIEEENPED